jgi:hypothetical protein
MEAFLSWVNAELDNWERDIQDELKKDELEETPEDDERHQQLLEEQEQIDEFKEIAINLAYNNSLCD